MIAPLAVSKPDLIDSVTKAYGTLAILLAVLVVLTALLALAATFIPPARRALRWLRETLAGSELWLAFAIALGATLGSLFLSEYADFEPCRLCWFQRIAMYPLVIILFVAAVRRDRRGGFLYAIPFAVIGPAISLWHIYVEAHPEADSCGMHQGAVPCSLKYIEVFGFVTIPKLALASFAAILTLLLLSWPFGERTDEEPEHDEQPEPDDDPAVASDAP